MDRNICVVQLALWSTRSSLLKCTLEEADVHCGPRLQEMYRPGHMEVDGGFSLFPQAHKEPIHQHRARSGV